MSYDNSKSMPSSSTRGRVARADEKDNDQEAESEGLNSPKTSGGQPSAHVSSQDQGSGASSSSSPSGGSGSGGLSSDQRGPNSDDMDGLSSGNDSGERESEGGMERENGSRGRQSIRSSNSSSNGKDSGMMLETTESNKSSNSQSLSPPSGSLAYSLLLTNSEHDPPSTSGCSSDQSARVQTQKELMKAIKELKLRLPAERKSKGHSSTLNALKYALQCVRQVRANKEYYHQWSVEECHGCSLDLSTFTIEELDNITSEYTLKNTDTFSMAVSFLSGKVVYVSPQGSSLLRCKPEYLQGTVFSELLAPQDVSTFYSGTAPCRLPPWASCIGSASPPVDCTQEKSMFCRISADRTQGGEMRYYPFRLTPYQLTLRDSDAAEPQPCCLLIAERVHSGYEAPRIPPDKRIFTTSHTPSCLFQEVDERAVPLLGYLPQDLVGTPILLYIHPEDRPMMVAIHEKIFQFAGQPFDYSPMRMCARSGEYVTIDTSWSSFVNPWSRKVAFVVGRHKVRTSPLNEDVFTTPQGRESQVTTPDIVQLSERIHRHLVQPVHSGSSQGYSSLGSSGSRGSHRSHQQHLSASAASSSDSNGPAMDEAAAAIALHKPMTFQQICKDVHMVKTNGQQVFIESRNRPLPRKNTSTGTTSIRALNSDPIRGLIADMTKPLKALVPAPLVQKEPPTAYSYQQINCLDSIIRYLESCNIPNTVKRKCGSSSCTASSTSDDDRQEASGNNKGGSVSIVGEPPPLPPLTMATKAESVASVTSQCSFSSTIVHVGDKKPPESDIVMEEAPTTPTLAPPMTTPTLPASGLTPPANTAITPPPPPPPPPPPLPQATQPERDSRRNGSVGGGGGGRLGLTKEVLSAHTQQEEQAFLDRFKDLSKLRVFDQTASSTVRCHTQAANPLSRGVRCSRDYPAAGGSTGHRRGRGGKRLRHQESSDQHSSLGMNGCCRDPRTNTAPMPLNMPLGPATNSSSWPSVGSQASIAAAPFAPGMLPIYPVYPPLAQPLPIPDPSRFPPTQMVPPMMALVLPNYIFPQMGAPIAQPGATPGHFYNPNFPYPGATPAPVPTVVANPMPVPGTCAPSRSSTPHSYSQTPADREGAESPLFQSRCSSPLNLLQLEESPSNRLEVATALAASQQATPSVQGGAAGGQSSANQRSPDDTSKENENGETNESNNDAMSTSSDLLDLLLQEDSRSGTGSAASGSGFSGTRSSGSGSGSNGCSSSGTSGTSSSQGSHTSKYFGSIDSSENDHSRKQPAGGSSSAGGDGGEEQFIKCVLQDPIWLLMANTDDKVMMTYQLPVRDMETVLREDREALRSMQKHQPRFTEDQKRELSQVHPWIRTGRLPRAINISGCAGCKSPPSVPPVAPFDVEIHEMELCSVLKAQEEGASMGKKNLAETAMDEAPEDEEEEAEEKGTKTQDGNQDMTAEEQRATSEAVEEKAEAQLPESDMTH
ncbi:period circadian protein homolog 1 isoform X1 [Seriola lalandi dorsalis]|uniref:Period circadian clock 1b n=1 Tax=Seriola lalandi dorsalis TaxID=1841481 RepID=A0A3B4Z166_SERLL|nr:period circadian protein homolog 1 isoform X1 [Seriola lalandi dorsalis]XP_023276568.1 period circadian protein homolog 1 isoform X1 [Seriola lalandi dorsalis]XP_056224824.1 period circadian protein homolog 1b [Seriola aureovittata]XP_056224825.1 period circadian protein homolog 1b [Seriola aureovittata]